ncbi:hypothetical protein DFH09DRAFT_1320938 [Mycena vulgaris]|nr:hypothetical protein DFH09DRAFT_1320938 [Mycena vulgaris]
MSALSPSDRHQTLAFLSGVPAVEVLALPRHAAPATVLGGYTSHLPFLRDYIGPCDALDPPKSRPHIRHRAPVQPRDFLAKLEGLHNRTHTTSLTISFYIKSLDFFDNAVLNTLGGVFSQITELRSMFIENKPDQSVATN